jgi:DNA-binding CsgD family transcriptional regulator
MSLHLTEARLRQIREVQEVILAAPEWPAVEPWADAVHSSMGRLFGTERSLLVLPLGRSNDILVHASHMAEPSIQGFRRAMSGTGERSNEYEDPVLNRAMRRLALAGVRVWSVRSAERITRIELAAMPRLYPEVIRPGRLEDHVGMTQALPAGQALFHVFADPGGVTRLGDEVLQIFHLLRPAFGAAAFGWASRPGVDTLLKTALDAVGGAAALYQRGRECFRNAGLTDLLRSDPQRDELTEAMLEYARRFTSASHGRAAMLATDLDARCLTTAQNRYRLTATRFERRSESSPPMVMISVRPAVPPLPDADHLAERYGLTARQSEVALLLARGMTNQEIADRLGIAEHTARHHAQRVLEKVGIGTRKALAMRLLADRKL